MSKTNLPQQLCHRTLLYLRRNSATILTCVSALGVIATAVSTATATPKALQKIKGAEKKEERKLTKFESAIVATPSYLPSLALGIGTIACMFSANALNKKQQAMLISAYSALGEYHKEYRNKLIELHGKEVDDEVEAAIMRTNCEYHCSNLAIPDGKFTFLEPISGETFESCERNLIDAEYHLNRNFVLRGYAPLNEFYAMLGLPSTADGEKIGWTVDDGIYWIDFEHRFLRKEAGKDVYVIDYVFSPEEGYADSWL